VLIFRKMLYRQLPQPTLKGKILKDANNANHVAVGRGSGSSKKQTKKKAAALDPIEQDIEMEDGLDERQEIMKVETFPSQAWTSRWVIYSNKETCPEICDVFDTSILSKVESLSNDAWSSVIMSNRSMIASSCCIGGDDGSVDDNQPLYGVAYSSLIVKNKSEFPQGQKVYIEGISLFPPGEEWIGRALYCCGMRLNNSTEKRLKQIKLSSIGTHHSICTSIFNRLILDRDVTEDKHLIAAVDFLFSDLLLDPSSETQQQVSADIDHILSELLENLDLATPTTLLNQPISPLSKKGKQGKKETKETRNKQKTEQRKDSKGVKEKRKEKRAMKAERKKEREALKATKKWNLSNANKSNKK
jgi:hypothetical protein